MSGAGEGSWNKSAPGRSAKVGSSIAARISSRIGTSAVGQVVGSAIVLSMTSPTGAPRFASTPVHVSVQPTRHPPTLSRVAASPRRDRIYGRHLAETPYVSCGHVQMALHPLQKKYSIHYLMIPESGYQRAIRTRRSRSPRAFRSPRAVLP